MNRIEERARIEKLIGPLRDASGRERRSVSLGCPVAHAMPPMPEPEPEDDSFSSELEYLLISGRRGQELARKMLLRRLNEVERERDQRMADIRNGVGMSENQIRRRQNTLKAEARAAMSARLGPCAICTR